MIGLVRLAVCSLFLVVCSPFAMADSLTVTGNVSFTPSSLTFAPPFATQADSGIFSQFSSGQVNYFLGTVPYTNGFPQTEEAFTITSNGTGDVLAFYAVVNSPTQSYDASGNLEVTLDETGYYTLNGGPELAGTFDLGFDGTSPSGSTANVPFLGTGELTQAVSTAVAPEPGSFALLGTGFLALAVVVRTRRKVLPATNR